MRKQTIKPAVFDGTNRLETPTPITLGRIPAATFACWVKQDIYGSNQVFFGNRFQMVLLVRNGKFAVSAETSSPGHREIVSAENAVGGERYYLVGTYDNSATDGRLKLYINGELAIASDILQGNLADYETYPVIAGSWSDGLGGAVGEMHDALIYTQALTPSEIKKLYNKKLGISAVNLKYLGLNKGLFCAYALDSENEGMDLSGNGYHLSNINNVTFNGSAVDTLHTGLQTQNTLKVDGTQYLTGAKISEVGEDFFFSGFAKFDDLSVATQYIFEEGGKVSLRVLNSGGRFYISYASTVESRQMQVYMTIIEGQLYHLAGEVDATTGRFAFYVDGVKIGEDTVSDTNKPNANTGIFAINYGSFRMKGSLHNIYFGRKAFGQQGVDWFRNKGVPRDLSIMPSTYASEALSIYEPTLLNGGADISGNGNDCSIVGTPAYTATEEVQKISNYQTGL